MEKFTFSVTVFTFLCFTAVFAQVGQKCNQDLECLDRLVCVDNACKCKPKHVQMGAYCFPEVHYGEECWFEEQCVDHGQICRNFTYGGRRCTCDKYSEYNETVLTCIPKKNLTSLLEEKYNTFEVISGQAKSTFFGILVIGLLTTVIGFFCLIVASFYCCRMYIKDKQLDKEVHNLILKSGGKLDHSLHRRKTEEQRRKQLNDAAIDPMIGAGVMVV